MEANPTSNHASTSSSKRIKFGLGNLLLLVTIVAILVAWWVDRQRVSPRSYDIPGPIFLTYKVRTSQTSTMGGNLSGVQGIDYEGNNIVVYTQSGGTVLSGDNLIQFSWTKE